MMPMKKHVVALGMTLLLASGGVLAASKVLDFELQELPGDRSSMDYGAEIQAFSGKVLGKKWVSDNNVGFVFYEKENRYRGHPSALRQFEDSYFFDIHKYMWDRSVKEYTDLYAIQSKRVGFIEFADGSGGGLHFRLLDDDTLELVFHADSKKSYDQLILKRVNDFPKRDKDTPKLKSAKERGVWFD